MYKLRRNEAGQSVLHEENITQQDLYHQQQILLRQITPGSDNLRLADNFTDIFLLLRTIQCVETQKLDVSKSKSKMSAQLF